MEYLTLLDAPRPRIIAYRQETVIAEKFEAAVVLAERNSRAKDFYDLYMLPRVFGFDGEVLVPAVAATFAKRATPYPAELQFVLPSGFFDEVANGSRWRAYLDANRLVVAPRGRALATTSTPSSRSDETSHLSDTAVAALRRGVLLERVAAMIRG